MGGLLKLPVSILIVHRTPSDLFMALFSRLVLALLTLCMDYPCIFLILLIRISAFCEPFSGFFGITEYHLENLIGSGGSRL